MVKIIVGLIIEMMSSDLGQGKRFRKRFQKRFGNDISDGGENVFGHVFSRKRFRGNVSKTCLETFSVNGRGRGMWRRAKTL